MKTQLARSTRRTPSVFDDFFDRPWNSWLGDNQALRLVNVPFVNIAEREEDYLVSMAAPGLKKEDFKIEVEGNLLTISSEKEQEREEKEETFSQKEYSYSSFERCFTLPDEIDKEKIQAEYKDGILKIELAKKEEAKGNATSKMIEIK